MTTPAETIGPFTPKLVTVLREGYGAQQFKADALAGLTVAIVALPLSMAIAIGSGAKPEHGLYSAIVGGFVISALGGSRFQIGGPAAAFIGLVATTITRFGYEGFLFATLLAGLILLALGYLRLGSLIRHIPHPVLTGFTAAIAIIIFLGELRDLFGLALKTEPASLLPRLNALWEARASVNPAAIGLSVACLAFMLAVRRYAPTFPFLLAGVFLAGFAVWGFELPVETIGSKFGGIPDSLPSPAWPRFDLARLAEILPSAIALALLGGMESLLSAVVADGMSGRQHRSNCELVAQGYANIACAFFGAICATGTIARTATNIRAHAHGPISGMLHAVFLLLFMMLAAPLAAYVPLSALACVLALVAWNMIEKETIAKIFKHDRAAAAVITLTFVLVVFVDLIAGIAAGAILGIILQKTGHLKAH